jgi:hypothetical protein
VDVSIAHEVASHLSAESQDALKRMRTDLDRFTDLEIECLIDQGYTTAQARLVATQWMPPNAPSGSWCPVTRSGLDRDAKSVALQQSSRRRWLPLVTALTDVYTYVLLALLLAIVVVVTSALL